MNQWGVSPGCTTPGRKGPSPQRHKYTKECHRIAPSSNQPSQVLWGNHCGSDDRDCHTHTTSQSRCVPCSDPHVHKVARSTDTRQECTNSSAKAMGTSPPSGEDTPCRREVQRKEKGGGTSAKGSVLRLTCVPLPHLVLPLSGCACSGTPTKATRGEARGHP